MVPSNGILVIRSTSLLNPLVYAIRHHIDVKILPPLFSFLFFSFFIGVFFIQFDASFKAHTKKKTKVKNKSDVALSQADVPKSSNNWPLGSIQSDRLAAELLWSKVLVRQRRHMIVNDIDCLSELRKLGRMRFCWTDLRQAAASCRIRNKLCSAH